MSTTPITRQIAFFVLAVLMPSALLLAAGFALNQKESELAQRRASEFRTFAARQAADSLLGQLEAGFRHAAPPRGRYHGSLLVVGRLTPPKAPSAGFSAFLREGARQEVAAGRQAAVSSYRARLDRTNDRMERAFLMLRLARAMEDPDWDRQLLDVETSVTDEFGLPMAYYAAERIQNAGGSDSLVAARLRQDVDGPHWMSREAMIFASDLTGDSLSLRWEELRVARDLRSLPAPLPGSPRWQLGPDSEWLLRLPDASDSVWAGVRVTALPEFLASLVDTLHAGDPHAGEERLLVPHFPGLVASISESSLPEEGNQSRFFLAGLAAILGLTLFGGYLMWRDIQREARLSRLRTRFVSSVSHELRTPLTSIRLFAESMAEDGSTDEEERNRGLSIIAQESDRLTRMLNNVMSTSKIEQGAMRYRPVEGDLVEIVDRAAAAMRYEFLKEGVELAMSLKPACAAFDPDAVEQAVLNLLSNALKYGREGGKVELSCERQNGRALVSVTDLGPGIASDEHEAIFERYYRSENASASRTTGAGLGLALVRHIAEGHDGSVEIESAPGEGSTFTLVLPAS